MLYRLGFFIWILVLQSIVDLSAQEMVINDIQITGNKRTKERVIQRELDFKIGDTLTLSDWETTKTRNEEWVMNTGLFTQVVVDMDQSLDQTTIKVEVKEFWYVFPLVLFKLADRNFSIWWSEQNRSLDRVNYGMRFFHHNFCLLYTSPSPRDATLSRMPSSA